MAGNEESLLKKDAQPLKPLILSCPNCQGAVTLLAGNKSLVAVCSSCGSTLDTADQVVKVIDKNKKSRPIEQTLEIGMKGKFHGHTWQIIGFMVRRDKSSHFKWREYLLFNPRHGFRFLTEAEGHWNWVVQLHVEVVDSRTDAQAMGKTYQVFHRGTAIVDYVAGEFYWRVKVGDTAKVADFINPPEVLSKEVTDGEKVWAIGEYMDVKTVENAFDPPVSLRIAEGVAPNQPSLLQNDMSKIWTAFFLGMAVLVATQFFTAMTSKKQRVAEIEGSFTNGTGQPALEQVSEPFELKGGRSAAEIALYATVDNDWFSGVGTLTNVKTGETFEVETGVEYYWGTAGGEPWSEGDNRSTTTLYSIPEGTYRFSFQPNGSGNHVPKTFRVALIWDVTLWANFWYGVIAVALLPLIAGWRRQAHELKRWSESDYAPAWAKGMEDEE